MALQWSHMKDEMMKTIEQSEKNNAGAPTGLFRGPKGTQRSCNGYKLNFPVFLNKLSQWPGNGLIEKIS